MFSYFSIDSEEHESAVKIYKDLDKKFWSFSPSESIDLSSATPVFSPFEPPLELVKKLLYSPNVREYGSSAGEELFKKKILYFLEHEIGIISSSPLSVKNIVFGNGVTHLFVSLLKSIIKNKNDVIVIASPGYGLFAEYAKYFNIRVVGIPTYREHGWILQPDVLLRSLTDISNSLEKNMENNFSHDKPKIRGFLHSNPHNPTGAVYDKDDICRLAEVFRIFPDINIVDDLSYIGLNFAEKKPVAFASMPRLFGRTVTLLGMSKNMGATGLRAGVACASISVVNKIKEYIWNTQNFINILSQTAIAEAYSYETCVREARNSFLKNRIYEYRYRNFLLKALIYGVYKISDEVLRNEIIKEVYLTLGKKSEKILQDGMADVSIITPQSGGYFSLIDFSSYKGIVYSDEKYLTTSIEFCSFFVKKLKILMIPSELMLYPGESCVLRISSSVNSRDIIIGLKKIKDALDESVLCFKLKTSSYVSGHCNFFKPKGSCGNLGEIKLKDTKEEKQCLSIRAKL